MYSKYQTTMYSKYLQQCTRRKRMTRIVITGVVMVETAVVKLSVYCCTGFISPLAQNVQAILPLV
jgi:hypothetical protein